MFPPAFRVPMRTTTLPLLLALALALSACGDDDTTGPPRDATPPTLEILAPAPADSVLFAGPVLVRARCTEDDGRGCTVSVFLQGALVAQGADSVNAVVSLAPLADRSLRLSFTATNLSGGTTTAESGQIRVVSSRWTPVVTTPDFLMDASLERALYLVGVDDAMRLLDLRTGEDREIGLRHSLWFNVRGEHVVTAAGAVLSYGVGTAGDKPEGVREIGGSGAADPFGIGPQAAGRWAAWLSLAPIGKVHRDDVLAASLRSTPDSLQVFSYHLAENGAVAFAATRAGANQRVYLWQGDEIRLVSPAPAFAPLTDGTGVVSAQAVPDAPAPAHQLVYNAPGVEQVLTPLPGSAGTFPPEARPTSGYQIRNGWVAYHVPQPSGAYRPWIRSPSGERREVWPGSGALRLLSLGPAGEVLVQEVGSGALFLVDPPHARGIAVAGPAGLGSFRWLSGSLYGLTDRTMYRLERARP